MNEFKQYKRSQIAEIREVTEMDISNFKQDKHIHSIQDTQFRVSISDADLKNGSPKIGDMIARNPKNHEDQWLIAKDYFNDNFEALPSSEKVTALLSHEDICNNREAGKELSAVDQFLFAFEPAGSDSQDFREGLLDIINNK